MNTTTTTESVSLKTAKVENTNLIPQGAYEFELGECTIKEPKSKLSAKGTASPAYIEVDLRLFGGNLSEKGRPLFPKLRLHLSVEPNAKGGRAFESPSGLAALFDSLGVDRPDPSVIQVEATREDGSLSVTRAFNPEEVKEAILACRGMRGKLYLRVRANTFNGQTRDENDIARFIRPSPTGA